MVTHVRLSLSVHHVLPRLMGTFVSCLYLPGYYNLFTSNFSYEWMKSVGNTISSSSVGIFGATMVTASLISHLTTMQCEFVRMCISEVSQLTN